MKKTGFCDIRSLTIWMFAALTLFMVPADLSAKDLKQFMLRAYVYDDNNSIIDSVTVNVMKDDTISVNTKLLKGDNNKKLISKGELRAMVYSGLGKYKLLLYKEGYELLVKEFEINSMSEDLKYLHILTMKKEESLHKNLDEVTVESTRIKMVMKGDTLVFDAAAFNLSEGSMLEELVRQLPNTKVDANGLITVNGKKITELLLNGKDFFKGDPNVALQNLPSYTVKNIKVYDKAADNAYLTNSDAKFNTREQDQNMVMDVVLKKEYNTGWMANATAGYGTADRYQGRAFGIGYTDKFRLATFINGNNVGNTSSANAEGNWNGGWGQSGVLDILMGGLDYSYDDSQKWRISGNLKVTHEKIDDNKISANTNFYPSGDIYSRSITKQHEDKKHLMTNHYIRYNGSIFSLIDAPMFEWLTNNQWKNHRSAQFDENPFETYRGEAVDSLFSNRGNRSSYNRYLLTRLREMSRLNSGWIIARNKLNMTLKPKTWKGYITLELNGKYDDYHQDERTTIVQKYGPIQSIGQSSPINRDQWQPWKNEKKEITATAFYTQNFRKYNDVRAKTWNMSVGPEFTHEYTNDKLSTYIGTDSVADSDILPSLIEPAGAILDILSSYLSRNINNKTKMILSLNYNSEMIAPTDSGLNLSWYSGIDFTNKLESSKLYYVKPSQDEQSLSQLYNLFSSKIYCNLNSTNNKRNINANIFYDYQQSAPNLMMKLDGRASSNPLNVYIGAKNLKRTATHTVNFSMGRWNRNERHSYFQFSIYWSIIQNALSQARTYNKYTGVSTFQAMNISGNWKTGTGCFFNTLFGHSNKFEINGNTSVMYQNSVDYVTLDSSPLRSSVRNLVLSTNASLSYHVTSGSTLGLTGSINNNNAWSERDGFNTINSYDYSLGIRGDFVLPLDIRLKSSLNMQMHRKYLDKAMNSDEWLWNASLEKSIMKGNLTMRIEAVDILNSVKNISFSVNSQGRFEKWQNHLPRYMMLSLNYKFSIKPKNEK